MTAGSKEEEPGCFGCAASYLLSPGTHFMTLAEQECTRLAKQVLQTRRFSSLRFFVSGSSSYGEGELKLADWINSTLGHDKNSTVGSFGPSELSRGHPADSVVIIGGDADLLVQCLALPSTANLYVYSPQAFTKSKTNRVLYSLHALLGELERHFPGKSHLARNDLALLCMLNGNDYLPKIPGFSFAHFASAYEATRRRSDCANEALIDSERKSFNWRFFSAFLEELNSLSSFARIARQREERLGLPQHSAPGYRASPLQILNQLVAQKRLGVAVEDGKDNLPDALQVLELWFPQLLHLVERGPWNKSEADNTAKRKANSLRVTEVADFHKAAALLRATTPSNTLNNLCLALKELGPTLHAALRKLAWEDDGSRLLERRPDETLGDEAASAATLSTAQAAATASDVVFTEEQLSGKAHTAQEAAKAVAYLHGALEVAPSGLLWNLHMYVDGVCPDNQWHYPFSSGPSPSAVQEVVHLQLHSEDKDPFSRLFTRCRTKAVPAVPDGTGKTPLPISQSLYTAALLPPEALQDLDIQERAAAADGAAPHSKRLTQARALLEAAVHIKRLRQRQGEHSADTEGHSARTSEGGAKGSTTGPSITAGGWQAFNLFTLPSPE
ncbi:hypothetical protein Emag_000405 [Eimeria magna]